jgi:prolyl-tRNA editing enzyme YbaK/EbsC (Cys-tRNA(Pro) deacylase)
VLFGMNTIMDEQLKQDEYLVMQAGTHTAAIKVRRVDWERACQPMVAPIAAGTA